MRTLFSLVVVVALGAGPHAVQPGEWPQFGGPGRDFTVDSPPLIDEWPEQGPTTIWSRPLGPGNAGIVVADDRLYTLYGSPRSETVVALSADDGSTLWEHRYSVRLPEGMNLEQSAGPHATPLVHGELLITVGVAGTLVALERATGEPIWTRELIHEEGATPVFRGYSSSPLAWGDTVILPAGGVGRGVMAFRVDDGSVAWSRHDFVNANASPILGAVDGMSQLIVLMMNVIAGFDPANGDLLWSLPVPQRFGEMISTPALGDDGLLFSSVPHDGGSRVIEIEATVEAVTAEQLWQHRDLRLYYTNAVRIGDWVYGSSGDLGPTFFTAVNVHTGEVAWRSRELMRSNFIHANGRLILRDEEGRLTMARVSPAGLELLAQAELFEPGPPVAPSLVEGRLYVRDADRIAAFDLRAARE